MLSPLLHAHFKSPRNVGRVVNPSGRGAAEHPACGDVIKIEVRVEGGIVAAAGFLAQGCSATLACGSFVTEKATGLATADALALDADRLLAEAGESGPTRRHGMTLAVRALRDALRAAAN